MYYVMLITIIYTDRIRNVFCIWCETVYCHHRYQPATLFWWLCHFISSSFLKCTK